MEFILIFFSLLSSAASNIWNCGDNLEWDSLKKLCKPCYEDSVFNNDTKKCQKISSKVKDCAKGFRFDLVEGKCVDIDECNDNFSPCLQNEDCHNTNGGFQCKIKINCGQGYMLDKNMRKCIDIDECKVIPNICGSGMICQNVEGSWSCRIICPKDKPYFWRSACHLCPEGFRLNRTTKVCEDVDECEGPYKLICSPYQEKCVKMPGLSKCKSHCSGTTTSINGICYDIDECATKTHNCTMNQKCENEFGTFQCLDPKCRVNSIFNSEINSCVCKFGFSMSQFSTECIDLDECSSSENPCGPNGRCVNSPGSFTCICDEGFSFIEGSCKDIDECKSLDGVCGNLLCENLPGSHKCVCPKGFSLNMDRVCEDINECAVFPKICDASNLLFRENYNCFNLVGSFKCIKAQCPVEYRTINEPGQVSCELLDPRCSVTGHNVCLLELPRSIFFHVVEIPVVFEVPLRLASMNMDLPDYDDLQMQIMVRKAVDVGTQQNLSMDESIIMNQDDSGQNCTMYLTKKLKGPTELIFDILSQYKFESQKYFPSLHKFHIFAINDPL